MHHVYNGMAATELRGVVWQKSRHSNSQGSCVEFAKLPDGDVAMRNSRHPDGPALVYTPAEIEALLLGVKDGEFDHLVTGELDHLVTEG
ncbi:DUF397 domain-containing protein [Streptomyces sp. A0958]|uniref:DUF397 domain-containing protein n=1 Tax=Streptomyces sp. A0958 TaxID=2563101 RepID=UPI00109EBBCD|nr:DUF397 domain-containing protein [Streptomyces sp. A0958]THA60153.1 DUF397 domain-containing protein [Streptomyces sp. A0958]